MERQMPGSNSSVLKAIEDWRQTIDASTRTGASLDDLTASTDAILSYCDLKRIAAGEPLAVFKEWVLNRKDVQGPAETMIVDPLLLRSALGACSRIEKLTLAESTGLDA